jgi:glycosyltransferase involved in cell wall biosynthesis
MPESASGDRVRIAIMHLTDTLDVGGAERMAVNMVNLLPRDRFVVHLCMTRRSGPLAQSVAPDVTQICLNRHRRVDVGGLRTLIRHIREHQVKVLHAHGSAVFIAGVAASFSPYPAVIWHIHYGRYAADRSLGVMYRMLRSRVAHALAVSQPLTSWALVRLRMSPDRVTYVPNFAAPVQRNGKPDLPGSNGGRVVCVANFLPEKDHSTLLKAMERVVRVRPNAHLLLVGGGNHAGDEQRIRKEIKARRLTAHVSLLGRRHDVASILDGVDIGVLSSKAEGLPLALIEYGHAKLPVVVTAVGQCPDVVRYGEAGLLVPPSQPAAMADGILTLLDSQVQRRALGCELFKRVEESFSAQGMIRRVSALYQKVAG